MQTTLTEQALCKLWFRADSTGDWMEMFQELHDIADVMKAAGQAEAGEMFADAAELALSRRVLDMRMRQAA